ncbi:MAG: hypothetical protein ACYC5Q_14875 [Thermoleophilia bacterium]
MAAPAPMATSLSFVVEDIDGEMRELRGRGVAFEDYDFPGRKTENVERSRTG